ncbi:MAG: T9SS type A sorting domain-containing protein [Saprospiraceae bacterium]|nr:T9SS type A sorting domain-containing protein [Saprospiraceae bacterium]
MHFNLGQSTEAEVKIFDSVGRLTQSYILTPSSKNLVIHDLVDGLNFIVLTADGEVVQSQIVVRN